MTKKTISIESIKNIAELEVLDIKQTTEVRGGESDLLDGIYW